MPNTCTLLAAPVIATLASPPRFNHARVDMLALDASEPETAVEIVRHVPRDVRSDPQDRIPVPARPVLGRIDEPAPDSLPAARRIDHQPGDFGVRIALETPAAADM